LPSAVRPDHADDSGGRQRELETLEEQPVAEPLRDAFRIDHHVAETGPGRDVDFDPVELHVLLLGKQLLVGAEARLRLRMARPRREPYPVELARQRAAPGGLGLLLVREPLLLLLE